jgi:hypothetical protein
MGTQLTVDLQHFEVIYSFLDGRQSPIYRVSSTKAGASYPNPYNTESTPFLIPYDQLGKFGYNVFVTSHASQPVWWSAKMEFFRPGPGAPPIASRGYSGQTKSFTSVEGMVGGADKPSLAPGEHNGAGMTPVYAADPLPLESPHAREFLWQPADLGRGNPVRMRIAVSARSSWGNASPANLIKDTPPIPDPPPNVVEFWICCV